MPVPIADKSGRHAADFGRTLYLPCITQNATYNDGNWQAEFTLRDGTKTKKIQLEDQDNVYFLGDLYNGTADEPARYINRPEAACYSICQQQLGPKGCTVFTYDGITEDRCGPALSATTARLGNSTSHEARQVTLTSVLL